MKKILKKTFKERILKLDRLSMSEERQLFGGNDGVLPEVVITPSPTRTPSFSYTPEPTPPPVTIGISPGPTFVGSYSVSF
ncbi:MAG: hypothetical protein LBN24_02310 [Mediterranea sp.]|jgi:hypothetical protein|nr:hypothetical protein [Mediterranea sp.]